MLLLNLRETARLKGGVGGLESAFRVAVDFGGVAAGCEG
jgi:hypothetical protein